MTDVCTYPRCKCIVSTSTTNPEPSCPRNLPAGSTDATFLRDLAERLMQVPASYGVDGYHIDTLAHIARNLDSALAALRGANRHNAFAERGKKFPLGVMEPVRKSITALTEKRS